MISLRNFHIVLALNFWLKSTSPVSLKEDANEEFMHPRVHVKDPSSQPSQIFEPIDHWVQDAHKNLAERLAVTETKGRAKNVIFYLGDGMSVQTITSARIFKGQKVDNLPFGEEGELYLDQFPFTGISKTFCSDQQTADSACSATAYLCGEKANYGTIGLTSDVPRGSCSGQADKKNHVDSILAWAQAEGKSTGIITTTGVTHASPAGTYAHIADREWESYTPNPGVCEDIAEQLILGNPGKDINVILGGGREHFLPNNVADPEYPNFRGYRSDGKNLIQEWINSHPSSSSKYITNRSQLLNIDTTSTNYLLGLFEPSHLGYVDERGGKDDPSLKEMVEVAIRILSKKPQGFFLFVEGGRIDHAHHDNFGQRALWETLDFDDAIKKGDELTGDEDTIIVVTSDHAHSLQFAGYSQRGNPIHKEIKWDGVDPRWFYGTDGLPFNILHYANGPGGNFFVNPTTGERRNVTSDDFDSFTYTVPTPIPLGYASHAGDDVLIFAKGPYAHLLTGFHQQSYIPHAVGYAACIGNGKWSESCPQRKNGTDDGTSTSTDVGTSTVVSSGVYLTTRYGVLVSCIVIIKSQI